jgi:hypothetical protein
MAMRAVMTVLLCVAGETEAQEMMGRSTSLFDLGLYGGGAYTTDWYSTRTASSMNGEVTENDDEAGRRIGFAPVFGVNADFFGLPWFGVRVHYGYMPSDLPEGEGQGTGGEDDSDFFVNNHFYDLSLVLRAPRIPIFSRLVSNAYFWVGGGGLTTNVAGEGPGCVPELLEEGACLSVDPDHASVGQGVIGIGGDIISLAANLGIFAELAGHIYDSPVHTGEGFVPRVTVQPGEQFRVADDKYAVTPRLVAGLKVAFGGREPAVVPVPAPVPPPARPPPAPPAMREIRVCVVQGGQLTEISAMMNPATGDTMVDNRAFGMVHPSNAPTYASGATWYINNDSIAVNGEEYVRFGVARVITPASQLTRVGEFQGTPIFGQTGAAAPQQVLYVPLRPGCEFQPYQLREQIRVRG